MSKACGLQYRKCNLVPYPQGRVGENPGNEVAATDPQNGPQMIPIVDRK